MLVKNEELLHAIGFGSDAVDIGKDKVYKHKVDNRLKCVASARYWMERTMIFIQHYMGVARFDDTLNIFVLADQFKLLV